MSLGHLAMRLADPRTVDSLNRLLDRLDDIQREFPMALNLGCRTGQLKDFGPDMGIFAAILESMKAGG